MMMITGMDMSTGNKVHFVGSLSIDEVYAQFGYNVALEILRGRLHAKIDAWRYQQEYADDDYWSHIRYLEDTIPKILGLPKEAL